MLNKPVEEIVIEGGHVVGVKSEGEVVNISHSTDDVLTLVHLQVALCSR